MAGEVLSFNVVVLQLVRAVRRLGTLKHRNQSIISFEYLPMDDTKLSVGAQHQLTLLVCYLLRAQAFLV